MKQYLFQRVHALRKELMEIRKQADAPALTTAEKLALKQKFDFARGALKETLRILKEQFGVGFRAQGGLSMKATVQRQVGMMVDILAHNVYRFVCRDKFGRVKWVEEVPNLVTTEGLNDLLTQYLKGSSYSATWFLGLINNADFGALDGTDTAARITNTTPNSPTTNDWQEASEYDESVRQTLTFGTASGGSIDNVGNEAVFTISGTVTIYGAFVISDDTKDGTTGVLYGEAAFAAPRDVVDDDTITVTVTATAASA